jgi:hypothetical protein
VTGARRAVTTASLAVGLVLTLAVTAAWAFWSAAPSLGNGVSTAATVNVGATPTAAAAGATVTVSWAASTLTSGQPVTGYLVRRYDATTLVSQTILTACTGIVAGTSCTESGVPGGQWVYTVTPQIGTNWLGAESPNSNVVTIDSAIRTPSSSSRSTPR